MKSVLTLVLALAPIVARAQSVPTVSQGLAMRGETSVRANAGRAAGRHIDEPAVSLQARLTDPELHFERTGRYRQLVRTRNLGIGMFVAGLAGTVGFGLGALVVYDQWSHCTSQHDFLPALGCAYGVAYGGVILAVLAAISVGATGYGIYQWASTQRTINRLRDEADARRRRLLPQVTVTAARGAGGIGAHWRF
jgi:hypothetical protein